MTTISEIAPDLYRISIYVPQINLQFNQFLIKDTEPLLFHTGLKAMFPLVLDAVATLIDPSTLRWIGFSHFESDECGSLNEWLEVAQLAQPVCSLVGAMVSVNDFSIRPARAMQHSETLNTGKYCFEFQQTPHVPHCWEAGLLFETTHKTLLSSDLFTHGGDVEALTESDITGRARQALIDFQASPLANYLPYTQHTEQILQRLAALKPQTLALMHGSSFVGDGEQALLALAIEMREILTQA
ncbi:MAG TPA: MBL fold metallo-hydrolase [Candidatus Sericytochromatia bacterium]|jgi:flavorubredoxin